MTINELKMKVYNKSGGLVLEGETKEDLKTSLNSILSALKYKVDDQGNGFEKLIDEAYLESNDSSIFDVSNRLLPIEKKFSFVKKYKIKTKTVLSKKMIRIAREEIGYSNKTSNSDIKKAIRGFIKSHY